MAYMKDSKGRRLDEFEVAQASKTRGNGTLPGPVVASRPAFFETLVVDTGRSCRLRHVALKKVTEVQFTYANYHHNEADANGPIKVKAAVETVSGTRFGLTFPGQDVDGFVTIPQGGLVTSNPIAVEMTEGQTFWSNTFVAPTGSGTNYPVGTKYTSGSSVGVGDAVTISATPYGVPTTTNPGIDTTQGLPAYGPLAITGTVAGATGRTPTVAIIGDSISCGYIDASNNGAPDSGFLQKALQAAKLGVVHMGMPGQGAVNFATPANSFRRRRLLSSCTHYIEQYGTNDGASRTAAQIMADRAQIWRWCLDRGIKGWATTITPRTNAGNTAAASSFFGPEGAAPGSGWTQVNTWLRAGAPLNPTTLANVAVGTPGAIVAGATGHPLIGIIDVASVTATYNGAADTFLWTTGRVQDGVHPNTAGHTAMQALVAAITSQIV